MDDQEDVHRPWEGLATRSRGPASNDTGDTTREVVVVPSGGSGLCPSSGAWGLTGGVVGPWYRLLGVRCLGVRGPVPPFGVGCRGLKTEEGSRRRCANQSVATRTAPKYRAEKEM